MTRAGGVFPPMAFWEQVLFSVEILSPTALVVRGLAMYLLLLFFARIMGQRELGTMSSFDVIVAITIGNIAAGPMFNSEDSVVRPAIAIATLASLHVATSVMSRRWSNLRSLIAGDPIVLVKHGKVMEKNLASARMSIDELMQELRLKNAPHLADVEYAVLEPKGAVSVLEKAERQAVTPRQMGKRPPERGLPQLVILDGRILPENLRQLGRDEAWLRQALARAGVQSLAEVAVGQLDEHGRLYLDWFDDAARSAASSPAGPAGEDHSSRLATTRLRQAAASLEALAQAARDPDARETARQAAQQIRDLTDRVLARAGAAGRQGR